MSDADERDWDRLRAELRAAIWANNIGAACGTAFCPRRRSCARSTKRRSVQDLPARVRRQSLP